MNEWMNEYVTEECWLENIKKLKNMVRIKRTKRMIKEIEHDVLCHEN